MIGAMPVGSVQILGAAFFSTCHESAQHALAGRERPFAPPAYRLLVGRARRFTSLVTQMHIEVCGALPHDAGDPAMAVFATCHGEIQTCEKLITDFRDNALVSSARFALSVHNTPAGVHSVATGSTAPTTTVTGRNAIAAGWLEASLVALEAERTVLLSIADEPVPAVFGVPEEPVGVAAAFLVGAGRAGRRANLTVTPCEGEPEVNAVQVLACAADAWTRREPITVALGWIQPGSMLELHFTTEEARA